MKKCLYCKSNNELLTLRCSCCGAQEFELVDYWPRMNAGQCITMRSYAVSTTTLDHRWPELSHKAIKRKM